MRELPVPTHSRERAASAHSLSTRENTGALLPPRESAETLPAKQCQKSCWWQHPLPQEDCRYLLSDRALGCPTSEENKIQDPFQWPLEDSCQWHAFHMNGARGGPLTHILICRAGKSTPSSSKAGGGTTRNTHPAATERACEQQVGRSHSPQSHPRGGVRPLSREALERDP